MVDGPEVMATTVARVESSVVTVARERAEMPWLKGWRQSTRPALSVEIRGKVTTYVLCIHDDGGRARALGPHQLYVGPFLGTKGMIYNKQLYP